MSDIHEPGMAAWDDPNRTHDEPRSAQEEGIAPPPSGDRSEGKSRSSRKLVVVTFAGIFVAIGGLGVLAYALLGGPDDDNATTDSVSTTLADTTTVADDFDRPDDSDALGNATTGQLWETPSGTWGVVDQQAYVAKPNADELGRSWAVTDLGSSDGSVTATAATMANGWGIVFRYRGPFNYWMFQGSTKYATYNLVKVVDGELESVTEGGIGLAPIKDGTMVGVEFQGPTITIMLNNQIVGVLRDTDLQNATKVGMIVSSGGAATARWDDFTAQAAPRSAAGGTVGDGG